jgi:hypothetical protein
MPAVAIPAVGDLVAFQDHLYADGSPVVVRVVCRTFGISDKKGKYIPYLEVALVSTLSLGES